MKHVSQNTRVLRQLRQNRVRGVSFQDFQPPVCDGLDPIPRLAARVNDLQGQGFVIRSERAANGTAVYFLLRERALLPEPPAPRPEPEPARELGAALFDATGFEHLPRGAYDEAA